MIPIVVGDAFATFASSSVPNMPGMRWSVTTTATPPLTTCSSAAVGCG